MESSEAEGEEAEVLLAQRERSADRVEETRQKLAATEPELTRLRERAGALEAHVREALAVGCEGVPQIETFLLRLKELMVVLAEHAGRGQDSDSDSDSDSIPSHHTAGSNVNVNVTSNPSNPSNLKDLVSS